MEKGRELFKSRGFADPIIVPFCPESELSGVGYKDFIPAMWYHRTIRIPARWRGKRIILNFGAVDYECEAFLDGISVGTHFGGTVSFNFDITARLHAGRTHHLVIRVKDDTRASNQPGGKQCRAFQSRGCSYTRTTGIWQTVWLEAIDRFGLKDIQVISDPDGATFTVVPRYRATRRGTRLVVEALVRGKVIARADVPTANGVPAVLSLKEPRLWSPENPFLYDLRLTVVESTGKAIDEVQSYAGLRKVHIEGNRMFLNNKPLYQRLVLDQGFYPDGVWTAPSDEALKKDILLSQKAGFNGARLHQKVFEERFHYWADKLGYLTWGESSSWGCDYNTVEGARNFLSEWREIIVRDRNHPSIIVWTPWNESRLYSHPKQHKRLHIDTYNLCKDLDPTRPINDASGYLHQLTDVWTVHNYEQNPRKLQSTLTPDPKAGVWRNDPDREAEYEGQPYLVDEYGGIKWVSKNAGANSSEAWGYGKSPKTLGAFYTRLKGLTRAILGHSHICGYCYTQLTDIEQEQNGIYNYDRTEKFNMKRIRDTFQMLPAAYKHTNDRI